MTKKNEDYKHQVVLLHGIGWEMDIVIHLQIMLIVIGIMEIVVNQHVKLQFIGKIMMELVIVDIHVVMLVIIVYILVRFQIIVQEVIVVILVSVYAEWIVHVGHLHVVIVVVMENVESMIHIVVVMDFFLFGVLMYFG